MNKNVPEKYIHLVPRRQSKGSATVSEEYSSWHTLKRERIIIDIESAIRIENAYLELEFSRHARNAHARTVFRTKRFRPAEFGIATAYTAVASV